MDCKTKSCIDQDLNHYFPYNKFLINSILIDFPVVPQNIIHIVSPVRINITNLITSDYIQDLLKAYLLPFPENDQWFQQTIIKFTLKSCHPIKPIYTTKNVIGNVIIYTYSPNTNLNLAVSQSEVYPTKLLLANNLIYAFVSQIGGAEILNVLEHLIVRYSNDKYQIGYKFTKNYVLIAPIAVNNLNYKIVAGAGGGGAGSNNRNDPGGGGGASGAVKAGIIPRINTGNKLNLIIGEGGVGGTPIQIVFVPNGKTSSFENLSNPLSLIAAINGINQGGIGGADGGDGGINNLAGGTNGQNGLPNGTGGQGGLDLTGNKGGDGGDYRQNGQNGQNGFIELFFDLSYETLEKILSL